MIQEITRHVRKARVALVGHEPNLGELAAQLIGARNPLEFKKGGICRIDFDMLPPKGGGMLRWFLTPKMLRAARRVTAERLMDIRAASLTAFYLYDVAEQIDLPALRATLGAGASARLQQKTAAPSYLQYQTAPLVVDGDAAGDGARSTASSCG